MKAMVYTSYGPPSILRLTDIPVPTQKNNEVLVKVHYAAVNSWDWDLVRGRPYITRLGGFFKPKYPVLGADIAGVVSAVGKDVTLFSVGDAVFGDLSASGWGGFAEFVTASEQALSKKPPSMSFDDAAALPQAGVLALQALQMGTVSAGTKLLINGAGGGVGTIALQIAKSLGAEVTCVDKSSKLSALSALGANEAIDYEKVDFTSQNSQYDMILDVVGNYSLRHYLGSLRTGGTYVMIGGSISLVLQILSVGSIIAKSNNKHLKVLIHKPNVDDQNTLGDLCTSGILTPIIDKVYPLQDVGAALQYLGDGHVFGKILVQIDDNQK
ncbi:MAG: NAD(P)-dependent alcohol dehydrogenase [Bacilli bacterium]